MKIKMAVPGILFFSLLFSACGGGSSSPATGNVTPSPGQKNQATITVSWDVPSSRANGIALDSSEIGGYRLYLSTRRDQVPSLPQVDIKDVTVTQYTFNSLAPGTYYIYMSTYDVNGNESALSDPVSKTL